LRPPVTKDTDTEEETRPKLYVEVQQASMSRCFISFTEEKKQELLECLFMFSLTWSIGAVIDNAGRAIWDSFLREKISSTFVYMYYNLPYLSGRGFKRPFPKDGTVYDYFFNFDDKNWCSWLETPGAKTFKLDSTVPLHDLLIPLNDNVSRKYLVELLMTEGKPVMLYGGIGKTTEITQILFESKDLFSPLLLTLSKGTST
jgi:dynein heavy chain